MPNHKNIFGLQRRGDRLAQGHSWSPLTTSEALTLAAWLVALADDYDEFPDLLAEVRSELKK